MDMIKPYATVEPAIIVAQVSQHSMNDYSDLINELHNAIEAIDEVGYQVTDEDLNRLYSAKDALIKWRPELEVK